MTKDEAIKLINENDNVIIQYDKDWKYPKHGDDQKTCPLLDIMFNIEYRSGTIIFVPDKINKAKRNKEG